MKNPKPSFGHKELMEGTLRKLPAFAPWPTFPMEKLLACSKLSWYAPQDLIPVGGDSPSIYIIVSGLVMQCVAKRDAPSVCMLLLGAHQIFGHAFTSASFAYIAKNEVMVIHVPRAQLFDLLDEDSSRWKHMGRMLMQQVREQGEALLRQLVGSLQNRLSNTIHHLAALYGIRANERSDVHLRLTQQDLAALLQVTRQSVSKGLKVLVASGEIELQYNAIVIRIPEQAKTTNFLQRPPSFPNTKTAEVRNTQENLRYMENALRKTQAFASWPQAPMERLLSCSYFSRHFRTEIVSNSQSEEGDAFLVVYGEIVANFALDENERGGAILLGPKNLRGFLHAFRSMNMGNGEYRAHSDVLVIHMSTFLLLEILDEWPLLWKEMSLMILQQRESVFLTLRSHYIGSLAQRIAATIDRMATLYGVVLTPDGPVRVHMSQATLSTILGSTRQAVHKELQAMAKSGVIDIEYGAITVLDSTTLRELADI